MLCIGIWNDSKERLNDVRSFSPLSLQISNPIFYMVGLLTTIKLPTLNCLEFGFLKSTNVSIFSTSLLLTLDRITSILGTWIAAYRKALYNLSAAHRPNPIRLPWVNEAPPDVRKPKHLLPGDIWEDNLPRHSPSRLPSARTLVLLLE